MKNVLLVGVFILGMLGCQRDFDAPVVTDQPNLKFAELPKTPGNTATAEARGKIAYSRYPLSSNISGIKTANPEGTLKTRMLFGQAYEQQVDGAYTEINPATSRSATRELTAIEIKRYDRLIELHGSGFKIPPVKDGTIIFVEKAGGNVGKGIIKKNETSIIQVILKGLKSKYAMFTYGGISFYIFQSWLASPPDPKNRIIVERAPNKTEPSTREKTK